MTLRYSNNAQTTLIASADGDATTITVASGEGDRFPDIDIDGLDWFPLTLIRADGSGYEIVRAEGRDGDVITIVRGQENTTQTLSFSLGDVVSLRMTSAAFDEFFRSGNNGLVVPSGINVATQTNASSLPYELELEGIDALTDGLRVIFKPLVTNSDTTVRIKINDLDQKALLVTYNGSDLAMVEGDLQITQHYEVQYSADRDRFVMVTPLNRNTRNAGSITAGVVEMPNTGYEEAVWNPTENPVSNSGAPVVFDRRGISKMIQDYGASKRVPYKWKNFGSGNLNYSHVAGSTAFLGGGTFDGYNTFEISNGEDFHCGDVTIIRAKTSITISGAVIIGHVNKSYFPQGNIGPRSGEPNAGATGTRPDYTENQQSLMGGKSGNAAVDIVDAIENGESMSLFFGAHGRGHVGPGEADRFVKGRGGLILISPIINIASSARIYMPIRVSEDNGSVNEQNGSGTTLVNTSAGGGGVLILSCEDLSISDNTSFKTHDPDNTYDPYFSAQAQNSVTSQVPTFAGAQSGKVFRVDTINDDIELLV